MRLDSQMRLKIFVGSFRHSCVPTPEIFARNIQQKLLLDDPHPKYKNLLYIDHKYLISVAEGLSYLSKASEISIAAPTVQSISVTGNTYFFF